MEASLGNCVETRVRFADLKLADALNAASSPSRAVELTARELGPLVERWLGLLAERQTPDGTNAADDVLAALGPLPGIDTPSERALYVAALLNPYGCRFDATEGDVDSLWPAIEIRSTMLTAPTAMHRLTIAKTGLVDSIYKLKGGQWPMNTYYCFSAGCTWMLLADWHKRTALAALGIQITLVVPNAMAIRAADVHEIFAYTRRSSWLSLHFTIHDFAHVYKDHADVREELERALLGALHVTSEEYLRANLAFLGNRRVVCIGSVEEVAEVSAIVASGSRVPQHLFALHGSTQRAAHELLLKFDEPFEPASSASNDERESRFTSKRAYLRTLDELVCDTEGRSWQGEFLELMRRQRDISTASAAVTTSSSSVSQYAFVNEAKSATALLHKCRHVDANGYYETQIQNMVASGWAEDDAAAVRMLPTFGPLALGDALRRRDSSLAASLHAVARGIAQRASTLEDIAPRLYMPMTGLPELDRFGLCDYDPDAKVLSRPLDGAGGTAVTCIAPPLTLRDDPTLMSESGASLFHYDEGLEQGTYVRTGSDIVCFRSEEKDGDLHTAVLTNGAAQVPTYALPPNTLLTLKEIHEPPFPVTFLRWHCFYDTNYQANVYVDRGNSVQCGLRRVPTMYKQLPDGRFEPIRPKLSAKEHEYLEKHHLTLGEIVDNIWYDESEVFRVRVTTCRMFVVRLTYLMPLDVGGGRIMHDTLKDAVLLQEASRRVDDELLARLNTQIDDTDVVVETKECISVGKYAESTRTLQYQERRAYSHGLEDLVMGLGHSLEDEWGGRPEFKWIHWTGKEKTAQEMWQYVVGPAVAGKIVDDDTIVTFVRDAANDGVTLDHFRDRINRHILNRQKSWQRNQTRIVRGRKTSVESEISMKPSHVAHGEAPRHGSVLRRLASLFSCNSPPSASSSSTRVEHSEPPIVYDELTDAQAAAVLTLEEVLAVRLYTGEGYAPINGWLREVSNLPHAPPWGEARWGAWTEARARMSAVDARREAALDQLSSFGMTVGCLTSAIRKIAAASTSAECKVKLYRGLKGKLESHFWVPDGVGIVCATDTAFMSTSYDEKMALFYMTKAEHRSQHHTPLGLLWELHADVEDDTGMHIGADVSMLSQNAHEKEVLFPPLTMLRVLPRDPPPSEDDLPQMPPSDGSEAHSGDALTDEDERKAVLIENATALMKRTMALMRRDESFYNGVPVVRVTVKPVYTGV